MNQYIIVGGVLILAWFLSRVTGIEQTNTDKISDTFTPEKPEKEKSGFSFIDDFSLQEQFLGEAAENNPGGKYGTLFKRIGEKYEVDPFLLRAISIVESAEGNFLVNNFEHSYGLMQILCKNDGDLDQYCKNELPAVPMFDEATPNKLLNDTIYNVKIAAQILKWNQDKFGFKRGVAVYNSWSARNAPENGPFPNQGYVDKVFTEYDRLRKQ